MALSKDDLKELNRLLSEQARIQQEINGGMKGYLDALKKSNATQETINSNKDKLIKLQKEVNDAAQSGNISDYNYAKARLDILEKEQAYLIKRGDMLKEQLKDANKMKMTFAAMGASALKGFNKLPNLLQSSFGKLKSFGLFEMDKAIKQSALDMGKFGENTKALQTTIRGTALATNQWGMGVKELSKLQSSFGDELGRNVMMGNEGLEAVSAMAAATQLGVEGAAKLTAEMDNQGLSAGRTAKYVEQTMNDTSKMGLNAAKVIKNIQNNMKMLNKYNFKGGAKGLVKMAQTTAKLGVDMNFVAGMAEKLFDIEGAVDMSAQLQVMGGEWSKLADPFKLMYMARNDMEGLTEAMGEAAASSAHFNKETGEFEISGLEMHRLRKIAEQTGVSYDELATAGKNAAKFSRIKSQIGFSMGSGKENEEMKEFLMNTAQLDEKGRAFIIDMKGDTRLLSELGASGSTLIKAEMANQATLAERAKAAQSFDEKITNLINMVKTTMLPIIDGIDEVLGPLVDNLFSKDSTAAFVELGKQIGGFIKGGLEIIKPLAEIALSLGPSGIFYTFFATKLAGFLFSKLSWIANGLLLAQGFTVGTKGGGLIQAITGSFSGPLGILAKSIGILGAGIAGWKIGEVVGEAGSKALGNESTQEGTDWAKWGAIAGGVAGLLLAPVTGGASLALTAAAVGGGALAGSALGKIGGDAMNQPVNDAKFAGMSNNERGIVQGGKITPIDSKDDLIAMKPGGGIMDGIINAGKDMLGIGPQKIEITFGEIHFKFDDLVIKTTDGETKIIGRNLLKNAEFTRDITKMIHIETTSAINGGMKRA